MTTLETNTAPVEASGEGTRTPEKAVRWAIPLSLLACVLLAFFDKISIAALFSDTHFQQASRHFDERFPAELWLLIGVFKRFRRQNRAATPAHRDDGGVVRADGGDGLYP